MLLVLKILWFLKIIKCCFSTLNNRVDIAPHDVYSYLVLIATFQDYTDYISDFCEGVILNEKFILSASYCYKKDEKWVVVLQQNQITTTQVLYIEQWILHPHYLTTSAATYNDIAILKLKDAISFSYGQPVTLNVKADDTLFHYVECKLVGFDKLLIEKASFELKSEKLTIKKTNLLKSVNIQNKYFYSNPQCESLLSLNPNNKVVLDTTLICAKQIENVSEVGHIGSPLFCQVESQQELWTLYGIRSKFYENEENLPEFFTRVDCYRDYIYHIIQFVNETVKTPKTFFCEIKVCGKKHSIYGEYCIEGDTGDCYSELLERVLYFSRNCSIAKTVWFWCLCLLFLSTTLIKLN